MSLELRLDLAKARLSTHESLRVVLRLRNLGPAARRLPYLDDSSDAVSVLAARETGGRARIMNGMTGQSMLGHARVDPRPALLELAAGDEWIVERDLGTLHYLLPAGRFLIQARLSHADEDVDLVSGSHAIEVFDSIPASVAIAAEPSLIDALILHLAAAGAGGERHHYVRQHTRLRPLATWFATEVEPARGADAFTASVGDFVEAPVADAFIDRHAVWLRDGLLHACTLSSGIATGPVRSAPLPAGWRWLGWAAHRLDGELWLALARGSEFGIRRLGANQLEALLTCDVGDEPCAVDLVDGEVHVVTCSRQVAWLRLDKTGRLLDRQACPRPGSEPLHEATLDARSGRLRLLFRDGSPGRVAHALVVGPSMDVQAERRIEMPSDARLLTEVAFDADPRGRVDMLVVADDGATHYIDPAGTWVPFVKGQARYLPQVVSDKGRVYLGVWRSGSGFRFIEHDRRDARFRSYETL